MAMSCLRSGRLLRSFGVARSIGKVPAPGAATYVTSRIDSDCFRSRHSDVEIPKTPVYEYVFKLSEGRTSQYGDAIAFKDGPKVMTHNQLKQGVLSTAETMQRQHGIGPGTMVGLNLTNCPEYAVVVHGAMAAGATVTTFNSEYTPWELTQQLNDANISVMVTNNEMLPRVLEANTQLKQRLKTIIVVGDEPTGNFVPYKSLLESDGNQWQAPKVDPMDTVAMLMYSSGTTGTPKGVMLTHHCIVSNLLQAFHPGVQQQNMGTNILGLLPFYHAYGLLGIINGAVFNGGCVSCLQKFEPQSFLKTLQDDKIGLLHIVPPIAIFLAKSPVVSQYDLTSVKEILCGAAPLSQDITDMLYQRMPALKLVRQGYGMTELGPGSFLDSKHREEVIMGSAGILLPNTMCKIIDLATGQTLKTGQQGEILTKGPQIMKGYHNNEKATKNTIDRDGWLHSGDVGYITETGHLFIVDRIKELIKVKGNQVAPAELEGVLLSHAAIADCCVVQKPDHRSGERPKAFVVLKADAKITSEEVLSFVNSKLTSFKHLVEVEFTNAIPKSPSGKILRRVLREKEEKKALKDTPTTHTAKTANA